MAKVEDDEEKGLLGSFKPHRRYGSTSVNMKKPDHIVVHEVSKGDTIQGIALRYGVSVESVKQHNKLWSSEAMFLHNHLEIPLTNSAYEELVKKDANLPSLSTLRSSSLITNGCVSPSKECSQSASQKTSESSSPTPTSPQTSPPTSLPHASTPTSPNILYDCSEKSSEDILSKIDSNIAQMKSNIAKMEVYSYPMLDQMELDDSNQSTPVTHRRQMSEPAPHPNGWESRYNQSYQNGAALDPTAPPRTIIATPGRNITMSLKRLLREQDSLYEL